MICWAGVLQAYKVYNLQTKTFHVFRDIIFHENVFPYHLTLNHPTLPLPFYLPAPTIFSHDTTSSYPPPTTSPQPIVVDPSTSSIPTAIIPLPRRTTQTHKSPSYLQKYIYNVVSSSYPNVLHFPEPHTYKTTFNNLCGVQAMETELNALTINNTWDLVPLPSSKKSIGV